MEINWEFLNRVLWFVKPYRGITRLAGVWSDLREEDIESVFRELRKAWFRWDNVKR